MKALPDPRVFELPAQFEDLDRDELISYSVAPRLVLSHYGQPIEAREDDRNDTYQNFR